MTDAVFNIKVVQPRMLSLKEAAGYLGVPTKRFPVICPVTPTMMPGDIKLYDRSDLDRWIDGLKNGANTNDDDIINKLGQRA